MPLVLLHLLFQIPAAVTAGTAFRNLLPFELDVKLVPLFLVLSCLAVLYMPLTLSLAFACALPVALVYQLTGTKLHTVVPFEVPEALKTLPWPRRTTHIAYYDSSRKVDPSQPVTFDDAPDDDLPAEAEEKRKSYIPPLP